MLVLSRQAGEQIVIGDNVTVTVIEVRGDTVRLGIDAPRSVAVNRAEVRRAVEASNREALETPADVVDSLRRLRPTRESRD